MSLTETETALTMLSPEKLRRYHSLHFEADRQRLLVGDWLVRSVLAKKLDCKPQSIEFRYNEYGKPYLAEDHEIYFNLSHSGNYVGAVFSDKETGFDIEEIKPLKSPFQVAGVFMSQRELSFFSGQPEENRQLWFYRFWSAKESFIKATGKGISEGLKSVTIDFTGTRILVYKNDEPLPAYYFHEIAVDPRYMAFVCGGDPDKNKSTSLSRLKYNCKFERHKFPEFYEKALPDFL